MKRLVVASVELYNDGGRLVQLDPNTGQLLPVNLAALRDLIGQSIAAVRVVNRDGMWQNTTPTHSRPSRDTGRPP